ncbi:unnamed protein product [Sphenostylis stenocarpa]|uniref:Uncharacterized protein n=1 Tax=Sphenostylis stenocarpa TaxID=92480 RepID=A0AA86S8W6_9FABA|nr:unnamed protein product [Sphenostylis stenocarpa]
MRKVARARGGNDCVGRRCFRDKWSQLLYVRHILRWAVTCCTDMTQPQHLRAYVSLKLKGCTPQVQFQTLLSS